MHIDKAWLAAALHVIQLCLGWFQDYLQHKVVVRGKSFTGITEGGQPRTACCQFSNKENSQIQWFVHPLFSLSAPSTIALLCQQNLYPIFSKSSFSTHSSLELKSQFSSEEYQVLNFVFCCPLVSMSQVHPASFPHSSQVLSWAICCFLKVQLWLHYNAIFNHNKPML